MILLKNLLIYVVLFKYWERRFIRYNIFYIKIKIDKKDILSI